MMTKKVVDVVSDVRCDVCGASCLSGGDGGNLEFGTLSAKWGYGSQHDGEVYEVHLCERCFFPALASMQEQRRGSLMFSEEEEYAFNPDFGLVAKDQLF